ncbi:MAG: nucleotidyltransferase [Desulfobacterales bacterium]|nr:nucleotidyltransferase [Desulfobacterales bacterium]
MNIKFPRFDPEKSGKIAHQILSESQIKGILIGRLAIWSWLNDDAGSQAYTKDMDIAISKKDFSAILAYLEGKPYKIRELPIGGVNVVGGEEGVSIDFIHRGSEEWGDLSRLYEAAIEKGLKADNSVDIGEVRFPVVPVEFLIVMKIATMERKDEDDAKRLLENIQRIDIDELRSMVKYFLGPLINAKLENMLREIGHPKAKKKYNLS